MSFFTFAFNALNHFISQLSSAIAQKASAVAAARHAIPADLLGHALQGDNKADVLMGTRSKNVFFGGDGNDTIIGARNATNTAVYTYSIDKYKITTTKDGISVKALQGKEGTDVLKNVSQIIFAGELYTVQATKNGSPAKLILVKDQVTPPEDTNTNPPQDTSTNPPQDTSTNPPQDTSTNPPQDTSTNPPQDTSTNPPQDTSTNPPQDTSTNPPQDTSTNPPQDTHTNPPQDTSTNPPQDTSTNPPQDTHTNPPQDTHTNPPQDTSTNPPQDTSTNPPQDTSTNPPQDTSTNPPQDTSTNPPDGDTTVPPPGASEPGDIVGFSLHNTSGASEGSGYVSFGQVFAKGEVMPGQALVAKINGQDVAVQMDVKTTNADGSVAHAVLTLKAPGMAADGSVTGMLATTSGSSSSSPAIQAQDILQHGYNFKVDVTLHNADGSTTVKSVDAAQLLQQAINSGNAEAWMKGAQASEYRVSANVAPNLDVKFDIRMDADGKTHTDVIFARDDAYTTNTNTLTYDVKFTQDGQTVFSDTNIQQYAYSTWHHDVGSAGVVDPQVVYDMQYLMNTGAIPSYDLSTQVSSSVTAGYMQQLAQADTGPMGSALVQKYMPMTGGREDIGPETGWTSNYITTQSADAAKVMYANADAAGSVPWHFVDTNGDAVRVDQHPGLWIDSRGIWGSDALPVTYDPSGTGWTPEVAHQPSLSYVPYLLSGEHYYLDELQAQASYTIASFDPYYRDGGEGVITDTTQARALGWALRDISNAAYITPDGEALKGYFTTSLDNTLDKLIADYVNGPKGDAEGQLEGWIDGGAANPDWIRPWQQDLLASAMAEVSAKGFDKADTLLGWMDNFLSGRFLNGDNGFDPLFGATYTFNMANGGQALQTWADVFKQTFGAVPTITEGEGAGFDWAGGYAANAKVALAGVISATQSPDAIEAYGWLQSQTTAMKAAYETESNWNIVPKLADGHYLGNDEIFVHTATTGTTMTAGNSDTMLIGNAGNDTIVGGSGIAMLFGMGGDDTIKAGSGNSYLYGGDGNDRLQDGSGANYFKGGAGADVFAFTTASTGQDTINDFTKGTDRIEIKSNLNGSGITTAAQLVSNATADADGNAVIHLGPQHDIVLQGVMVHQLTTDIFTIV